MRKSFLVFVMMTTMTSFASAKAYRYIAIDSGGMLGVIPAHLLADVEKKAGRPIHKLVDGMIGTSTSAIISAMLTVPKEASALPFAASQIETFYRTRGSLIFDAATQSVRANSWAGFMGKEQDFTSASGVLKTQTEELFGKRKLSHALIDLQVLSFDKISEEVFVFSSARAQYNRIQSDMLVSDAVRASSSLADAFGPLELQIASNKRVFIDAGSVGLRSTVTDPTPHLMAKLSAEMTDRDEAVIYSIGTGFSKGAPYRATNRRISVVRIEPNVEKLSGGRDSISMNLLASNTAPAKINDMIAVADALKSSPSYQRMLADLLKAVKHDEL